MATLLGDTAESDYVVGGVGDAVRATGGSLNDVKQTNTVIASHDVVAADAYAATLFDLTGAEVKHVQKAAEMGLGTLDLKSIKVEEVNA